MKELPQLSILPTHHPDCCCSLSIHLIDTLVKILSPAPFLTVSIGSGTGLLEALLLKKRSEISLKAVEASNTANQYIREEDLHIVLGTWDICSLAADAEAWLFVYPREAHLLSRYLQAYGSQSVRFIIWLGPKADFSDYAEAMCMHNWQKSLVEDSGLRHYELMVIWERNLEISSTPVSP